MDSSEKLLEALVSLKRDNARLRVEGTHATLLLRALDALLTVESDADPFSGVFDALRDVFAFSQAMVLAERGDGEVECIVALPPALIGFSFRTGDFMRRVMAGRVSVTFSNDDLPEWRDLPDGLIASAQPALYLPIRVRDRRGALVLLRAAGDAGFDRSHVALAKKFAVLASHALAARHASQTEAESLRLHQLMDQLRRSEQKAQRNTDLLNEIVNLLPVSLTVQDEAGRYLVVNHAAATTNVPDATSNGAVDVTAMAPGEVISTERIVETTDGPRTLLTSVKPVRIFDETLLLSTAHDITERKLFEQELARRAYYDDLTGLPSRVLIQQRVEQALEHDGRLRPFALAFIDLDNFKHINDYYSHAVGDAVLVAVARRIGARVRSTDLLARISGDEFVLLIDPIELAGDLLATIDGILADLREPFLIEGFEVLTSASIGVSVFPEHGETYEALRRNADSAMYRAKSNSKGRAAYFDLSMGHAVTARMELEQNLRAAIRERRFCCAFQPKVDIRDGRIVGFEALVRKYDEHGVIRAPGDFIGLATELGLIDQIARFVLADAVAALERLDAHFGADTTISINVAARQATDLHFMSTFADALLATGKANRFMLEVTEDAFVAAELLQAKILPVLRKAGVRVSIDDFGTGYSSLAALADITADELKVDRSFITAIHQRPRSQSVLKAIESMSRALGMTVVAEGVETFEELAYLTTATHIDMAQGYYFSKPLFVDELIATLPGLTSAAEDDEDETPRTAAAI
jgi:c-di-GMP phosphodiesterase Gmr